MIKFDCGRAPGLEKRLKREAEDADRTDAKVEGRGGPGAHCPFKLGLGSGGFPCRGQCLQDPCGSLARVGGQHPDVVSAPSTGHLQPSGDTQPPSNTRVKDKDQGLQEGVCPHHQPQHRPQADPRAARERRGPGRLSLQRV